MDDEDVTAVLTGVVETWIAAGSSGAVAGNLEPEMRSLLLATGYLVPGSGAGGSGVSPTSEALNLTDPFLCEELASAFRWELHRRLLAYRDSQT